MTNIVWIASLISQVRRRPFWATKTTTREHENQNEFAKQITHSTDNIAKEREKRSRDAYMFIVK